VTPHLGRELGRTTTLLAADPGLAAVFLGPDGRPLAPESVLRQPDLARTLDTIAADAGADFYRGDLAAAIVATVQAHGGVLTRQDLARYRPVWRQPLEGRFRGRRVISMPPPGSGGIVLAALGMLARDDPAMLGEGEATWLHLLSGVLAQAFADRARWYGDPDFTPVPTTAILAPPRLAARRARLSAVRIVAADTALTPDAGTAHVSVVDTQGNAVALTTTINTSFGSGLTVPGTGILLNDQMDDFALAPGVANVYGLTGGDPNLVAPGKRPQSSMSPTIVLDRGRPELVVGASGGPLIISGTIQVVLGTTVFAHDLPDAVAAPRIHDQGAGPALAVERGIDATARGALERLGHRIVDLPAAGAVAAAGLRPDGTPVAAGDLRKDGGAAVVP
jgi:gamma-glutamyltranspeptidase/glutathione hydrolase